MASGSGVMSSYQMKLPAMLGMCFGSAGHSAIGLAHRPVSRLESRRMTQDPPDLVSRRSLLERALGASVALGLPGTASAAATASSATARLRVVVTGGHPGDPEYGCGGTIARYAELGHDVAILYLNRGDPLEGPGVPYRNVRVLEAE